MSETSRMTDILDRALDRLRAENERLRAALKPFAKVAAGVPGNWPATVPLTWDLAVGRDGVPYDVVTYHQAGPGMTAPKIGDYRRAAEALKEEDR